MRLTKAMGVYASTLFVVLLAVMGDPVSTPRRTRAQIQKIQCRAGQQRFSSYATTKLATIKGQVTCAGGNQPCKVQYGATVYWFDFVTESWQVYDIPGGGIQKTVSCGVTDSYQWGVQFVQLEGGTDYLLEMVIKTYNEATHEWDLLDFGTIEFFVP